MVVKERSYAEHVLARNFTFRIDYWDTFGQLVSHVDSQGFLEEVIERSRMRGGKTNRRVRKRVVDHDARICDAMVAATSRDQIQEAMIGPLDVGDLLGL